MASPTENKSPARAARAIPIPEAQRANYTRVSVCFDATFGRRQLKDLAELCNTDPGQFYFAGSVGADAEAGLVVNTTGSPAGRKLHVTFEFRSLRRSPYPKIARRKMETIVRLVGEADLVVRHAEFAFRPSGQPLFTDAVEIDGAKLVLTGLEFEVVPAPPSTDELGTRVKRARDGKEPILTNWARLSAPVKSLAEGFALASQRTMRQPAGS